MLDLFKRMARAPAFDAAGLGVTTVARPVAASCLLPPNGVGVVVAASGRPRRVSAGGRLVLAAGETGWCFHGGPYGCDLVPFAAAPEIGLRVHFAIDSPDPRVTQQRFDLFLASEGGGRADRGQPCRAHRRGPAARAGPGQPRPAALHDARRMECFPGRLQPAALHALRPDGRRLRAGGPGGHPRFRARADGARGGGRAWPPSLPPPLRSAASPPIDAAVEDARALRRLFLELPCVMCRVREAALPQGQALFHQQQALLQRLDLACLAASTMPALGLAAPGQPLDIDTQHRRARHSLRAASALDEAWALLARLERAGDEGLELPVRRSRPHRRQPRTRTA